MISAFVDAGGTVRSTSSAVADAFWIDIWNPDEAEREAVQRAANIQLPQKVRLRLIEPSSHFGSSSSQVDLAFSAVADDPVAPVEPITCVLTDNCLITLRSGAQSAVEDAMQTIRAAPPMAADEVLTALIGATVQAASERLFMLVEQVDALTASIFEHQDGHRRAAPELRQSMRIIGALGTSIMRVEDSLVSLKHLSAFMEREHARFEVRKADRAELVAFHIDVDALSSRAEALNEKVHFLLSAMLGVIGHDQNQITMVLSLIAALFLPATLIAAIFGMNFSDMPGLKWHHGFFICLGIMVTAAGSMAAYFRWRRWL
ncbi:MAG: CorA family divalent cation transporter [Pseudomonadota bacterium]